MPEDGEPVLKVEHRDRELLDMFNTNQSLHCAPNILLKVVEYHILGQDDKIRSFT